jgi:hypothetical protein
MRLTNDLIGYYRSVQGVIEALLQDETLPPQRRQQLQSDLNIVTGYIKALQDFRRSL